MTDIAHHAAVALFTEQTSTLSADQCAALVPAIRHLCMAISKDDRLSALQDASALIAVLMGRENQLRSLKPYNNKEAHE